jgi:hypothetical protein
MLSTLLALLLAVLATPAQAWTLTVRNDPNDSRSPLDIRRVSTDLTRRYAYIRIRTWERMPHRGQFNVPLDTTGTSGSDRFIELPPFQTQCVVWEYDEQDGVTDLIGFGTGRRLSPHVMACRLPARWLGATKSVRFFVKVDGRGRDGDRAPNDHRYIGL